MVPLDLFPSNVLESVTVQKTYSADFPGEFGGGVIDLRTVDAPSEPFFTFSASIGANTETTGQESLIYYGSRTDFTGFDDGTRDVPGPIQLAFGSGLQINQANFNPEQLQKLFSPHFAIEQLRGSYFYSSVLDAPARAHFGILRNNK